MRAAFSVCALGASAIRFQPLTLHWRGVYRGSRAAVFAARFILLQRSVTAASRSIGLRDPVRARRAPRPAWAARWAPRRWRRTRSRCARAPRRTRLGMPGLQGQPPVALDEHRDRRDHPMKTAPGRDEIQPGHQRARRVLGAPGAGAPRRGQHDRAASAARQADLGRVPVADAGVVGAALAVDLGRAQEGQVHAATRAQIVEILVGEDRRRVFGQHRIGAGRRHDARPGIPPPATLM